MPYRGYDRYLRSIDRSCDRLLIEGPKLLKRSSSASYYQYVGIGMLFVEVFYSGADGLGASITLYLCGIKKYVHVGEASSDSRDDISYGSACRGCHHAYLLRKARYGPFMSLVEKSFVLKLSVQLFEGCRKGPFSDRLYVDDIYRVAASGLVYAYVSVYYDLHSLVYLKTEPRNA